MSMMVPIVSSAHSGNTLSMEVAILLAILLVVLHGMLKDCVHRVSLDTTPDTTLGVAQRPLPTVFLVIAVVKHVQVPLLIAYHAQQDNISSMGNVCFAIRLLQIAHHVMLIRHRLSQLVHLV